MSSFDEEYLETNASNAYQVFDGTTWVKACSPAASLKAGTTIQTSG